MKRIAVVVSGGAALALALTVAVILSRVQRLTDEVRRQVAADAERMLPTYLRLGAALDEHPFFAAKHPGSDAGPWLNPRMSWDGGASPAGSELTLPDGLADRLREWGDTWTEHAADIDWSSLDFAWMRAVADYGFWSILPGGPLEHLEHPRFGSMPLPSFIALQTWAKLRLLAARQKGDHGIASRELRQVAWLCHSTELLIGSMVAVAILGLERRAYVSALAGKVEVGAWKPFDEEWIADARAVGFAAPGFANPMIGDALVERARVVKAARCSGLTEMMWLISMRHKLGVPVAPALEREIADPNPPCRLDVMHWYLNKGGTPSETDDSALVRLGGWLFPATTDGQLESIAAPYWFKKLEERATGR